MGDDDGKEAESLLILSPKKFKNEVARSDEKEKDGKVGVGVRVKSEFREGQSFFGFFTF